MCHSRLLCIHAQIHSCDFCLFYVKNQVQLPVCLIAAGQRHNRGVFRDSAFSETVEPGPDCYSYHPIMAQPSLALFRISGKSGLKNEAKASYFNMNITELFFRPCLQVLEETELGLQDHFPFDPIGQVSLFPRTGQLEKDELTLRTWSSVIHWVQ